MKFVAGLAALAGAGFWTAAHAAAATAGPETTAIQILAAHGNVPELGLRLVFARAGDEANGTQLTLDLAPDYIRLRTAKGDDIFDYRLRRHFQLDDSRRSFANLSLYAEVAFRAEEAANRLFLGKVLARAGVQNAAQDATPALVECQLGIAPPKFPPVVLQQNIDAAGQVSFRDGATFFGSVTFGMDRFSDAERKGFDRFLHDAILASPQLVDAVGSDGRIPHRLSYLTWELSERKNVTLTLESSVRTSETFPLPAGYSPELFPAGGTSPLRDIFPVMRDAVAGTAMGGPRTIASYREAILRATKNDANLQAMVLFSELALQHGHPAVECAGSSGNDVCASVRDALRSAAADPEAKKLERALSSSAVPDAKERVTLLRQVDRSRLSNPYVIDLFIANDLGGGDRAAGPLYVSAIRGNPYVPGFYVDFGNYLYGQFDPFDAWILYDMARKLPDAAATPMAGGIDVTEQNLAADFPRFF